MPVVTSAAAMTAAAAAARVPTPAAAAARTTALTKRAKCPFPQPSVRPTYWPCSRHRPRHPPRCQRSRRSYLGPRSRRRCHHCRRSRRARPPRRPQHPKAPGKRSASLACLVRYGTPSTALGSCSCLLVLMMVFVLPPVSCCEDANANADRPARALLHPTLTRCTGNAIIMRMSVLVPFRLLVSRSGCSSGSDSGWRSCPRSFS